jgi:gas vesicle protein
MKYNDNNSKIFLGFAAGAIAGISLAALLSSEKQPDIKKKINDSLNQLAELVNNLFSGQNVNAGEIKSRTPSGQFSTSKTNIAPERQAVS